MSSIGARGIREYFLEATDCDDLRQILRVDYRPSPESTVAYVGVLVAHNLIDGAGAARAGNFRVEARIVQGVHHTLSVWVDEQAMRSFLLSGAHLQAMRKFRAIGTGRVLGFETHSPPNWEAGLQRWRSEAREV